MSLGRGRRRIPAVEAAAGPDPGSLGPGVWVLPVEGLVDLADRIGTAHRRIWASRRLTGPTGVT